MMINYLLEYFKILLFSFSPWQSPCIHSEPSFFEIARRILTEPQIRSDGILLASPTFRTKKEWASLVRTKVTLGDWSFQVAAPKLWNALPPELCDIPNLHTFKTNLKTYLFKFAYSWMNFNCYVSIF